MSILRDLELEHLSPARLWARLDPATRTEAARTLLRSDDPAQRAEANVAIATRLRFRPAAVQKLPVERRVGYLARAVAADDSLAGSLLLALHLGERRDLLAAFLDRLDIPHENGLIDPDHELGPPSEDALRAAADALDAAFPGDRVDLYLASLVALDPRTWAGLRPVLERRASA